MLKLLNLFNRGSGFFRRFIERLLDFFDLLGLLFEYHVELQFHFAFALFSWVNDTDDEFVVSWNYLPSVSCILVDLLGPTQLFNFISLHLNVFKLIFSKLFLLKLIIVHLFMYSMNDFILILTQVSKVNNGILHYLVI